MNDAMTTQTDRRKARGDGKKTKNKTELWGKSVKREFKSRREARSPCT